MISCVTREVESDVVILIPDYPAYPENLDWSIDDDYFQLPEEDFDSLVDWRIDIESWSAQIYTIFDLPPPPILLRYLPK